MWRHCVILLMTIASCAAIPKAGGTRELQRLVRLPAIDFPAPLHFDRGGGFAVFPLSSSAAAEVSQLLEEAKGNNPADAPLHLEAAKSYAAGRDIANSIRSYGRAADLFGRKLQSDPGNVQALIGQAEALSALGRFGEAQAALEKAAATAPDEPRLDLAYARFYKEKAWSAFAGEENRFRSASFVEILELMIRRGAGTHIETAQAELRRAEASLSRAALHLEDRPEFLSESATFAAFRAGLEAAFSQMRQGERTTRKLRQSLYTESATEYLQRAALVADAEPGVIASAMFVTALAEVETGEAFGAWVHLSRESRRTLTEFAHRLAEIIEAGGRAAAEATEYLACAQLYLMKDFSGAERNFRTALRLEPARERSWEMLIYTIFSAGDAARLVDACEERSAVLPNARSSVLLIKSYERSGDWLRAEISALSAVINYPNDFYANASLAALLLKRENFQSVLPRAGDALSRAEKQLSTAGREAQVSFVILKCIHLALSGQPEQARALLAPYTLPGRTRPDVQELLDAIGS